MPRLTSLLEKLKVSAPRLKPSSSFEQGIPTLDSKIYRKPTPQVAERFAFSGHWMEPTGVGDWLGVDEMESYARKRKKMIAAMREHWEGSAPQVIAPEQLTLFAADATEPDVLTFLVWESEKAEPQLWAYNGQREEKLASLAAYVTWAVTGRRVKEPRAKKAPKSAKKSLRIEAGESLSKLERAGELTQLRIENFDGEDFAALAHLTKLEVLQVMNMPNVTTLEHLASLTSLTEVALTASEDDADRRHVKSLEPLATLPKLKFLELRGVVAKGKRSLESLEACPSLKTGLFRGYTSAEVERFRAAKRIKIEFNPNSGL